MPSPDRPGPEGELNLGPSTPPRPAGTVILLRGGGDALEGPRHIWWNFVSSSKERIEQAKQDWKTGKFAPVPREHEFIPLPE